MGNSLTPAGNLQEMLRDMQATLEILERIHFAVGPEFIRQEVVDAIKLLKHGIDIGGECARG